jgi:hypothetical protein
VPTSSEPDEEKIHVVHVDVRQRDDRLVLAASRGVWEALKNREDLGASAARYGYVARTFEGDAFETAFSWAREEAVQ